MRPNCTLPMELIERATGEPIDSRYLVEHLATKCR